MAGMCQLLEGESAVLRENGVYREVGLAVRGDGELYARAKGGFVRLHADGSTSVGSKCSLDTLSISTDLTRDRHGKLCIGSGPDRRSLAGETPKYLTLGKE